MHRDQFNKVVRRQQAGRPAYSTLFMYYCHVHGLSQRVHLDISIGDHTVDYAQIAAKEKLTELQLRIRQLLDQVEQITKEQAYQRVKSFRNCAPIKICL